MKYFRPLHKSEVNFHQSHINSSRTLTSCDDPPPHWNQVNVYHLYINHVHFDAHTNNKRFAARIPKPGQLRPHRQERSRLIPTSHHQYQVSLDHHTNSSISMLQTKTEFIRSGHWKQVIFDRHTKIKPIPIPTPKLSQFWPPTQQPTQYP